MNKKFEIPNGYLKTFEHKASGIPGFVFHIRIFEDVHVTYSLAILNDDAYFLATALGDEDLVYGGSETLFYEQGDYLQELIRQAAEKKKGPKDERWIGYGGGVAS